jgi:hypothetical protein
MMEGVPVRIGVVFEPDKKAKPVWFELNRRKHVIRETTYYWKDTIGGATRLHYAVTTDEALYELVFNPANQSWTLHNHAAE